MNDHTPPALVLSDGGLEGLVAAAIAVERAALPTDRHAYLWCVPGRFEGASMVRDTAAAAAERQRASLKLGSVAARVPAALGDGARTTGEADSMVLLRAGSIAAELGLRRVIWPVRAQMDRATGGPDVNDAARIVDRAVLVTRLIELDVEGPGVTIETPLVDLADDQVLELAHDLGVPMDAVWWASELGGRPGEVARAERERWERAAVGV